MKKTIISKLQGLPIVLFLLALLACSQTRERPQSDSSPTANRVEVEKEKEKKEPGLITKSSEPSGTAQKEQTARLGGITLFGLYFSGGFLLGAFVIYSLSKSGIKQILNEEYPHYKELYKKKGTKFSFMYIGIVHVLKEHKDKYKKKRDPGAEHERELAVLKAKIKQLESEKKELVEETIELGEKLPENQIQVSAEQPKAENLKRLFFSIPNENGCFQIYNGSDTDDGQRHYLIEYRTDEKQGEISFVSGPRDPKAIHRFESFLQPVCDIENISTMEHASRIVQIKKGSVLLKDDTWVIDNAKKIKIKLQ